MTRCGDHEATGVTVAARGLNQSFCFNAGVGGSIALTGAPLVIAPVRSTLHVPLTTWLHHVSWNKSGHVHGGSSTKKD